MKTYRIRGIGFSNVGLPGSPGMSPGMYHILECSIYNVKYNWVRTVSIVSMAVALGLDINVGRVYGVHSTFEWAIVSEAKKTVRYLLYNSNVAGVQEYLLLMCERDVRDLLRRLYSKSIV